jgi:hypothetical protein
MFQYKTVWTNAERFLGRKLHMAVLEHDVANVKKLVNNPELDISYIWELSPFELEDKSEEERQFFAARAPVLFKARDIEVFREILNHPNAFRGIDKDYNPGLYMDPGGDTIFHAQIKHQTARAFERFKILLSVYPEAYNVENNMGVPLYQSVISNERVDMMREMLKYNPIKVEKNEVLWAIIAFAPHDPERMETTNKMLNLLRGHGWDFNSKDSRGATPLHWAARIGNDAMIEVLLALGVDSEQKDSRGFMYADELMTDNGTEHNGYNLPTYDVIQKKDVLAGANGLPRQSHG